MYNNYNNFRFEEAEEFDCLNNANEICELETWDLPLCCPYRQSFQASQSLEYMSRMPKSNMPSSPPPSYTPQKEQANIKSGPQVKAVDPFAIRHCLFRFVYIWPRRGRGFWAWLIYVGRRSAAGYRWNGRRWVYFGIDLRKIDSFMCM